MKSKREKRKLIWIIGRFEYDNGVIELCNWICAKEFFFVSLTLNAFSIKRQPENYAEIERTEKNGIKNE
jgi:hypothetical protein